jgi:DNA-directed RNA polymerase subunit RPC12/RpoP
MARSKDYICPACGNNYGFEKNIDKNGNWEKTIWERSYAPTVTMRLSCGRCGYKFIVKRIPIIDYYYETSEINEEDI